MSEVAEGLKRTGQPKPYQAHVQRGGRRVHLGSFAIAEEAALRVARSPEAQAAGAERTAAAEQAAAAAPLTSEGARLSSGSVRKSGTAVKMKRSPVKKKRASTKMPRVRVSASFLEFAERRTNQLWEEAEGTGVTSAEVLRPCIYPPASRRYITRTQRRAFGRYRARFAENLRPALSAEVGGTRRATTAAAATSSRV